ncbi:hypothetical protein BN129_2359 [Cronobacter sakazakii 701]|nr:hypothetical protein BN129_2359 [Cronobacter sakazakii 701]
MKHTLSARLRVQRRTAENIERPYSKKRDQLMALSMKL